MSIVHVNHIRAKLVELFKDKIDLADARSDQEKEDFFLTRAFAAYSLQVLAGIDTNAASACIVDGYDDNGVDAVCFDRKAKLLWIVQSKWIKSGSGEPDTGELNKFKTGVVDLVELQLDRFNAKIMTKEKEIVEALEDHLVRIKVVLAHTGKDALSQHNQRIVDDLLKELNDPTELAGFELFSLKPAHKSLVGILEGQPIKAELILTNWGKVDEPFFAIYGTINGADIAHLWTDYRGRLFSENIREFLGFSDVNEDILNTISTEPQSFYYFNNGVTALCKKIIKKPVGGGDRQSGVFVAEDFKIVNGAQTVGTLGNSLEKNAEKVAQTKVFLKVVSLEGCPDEFGLSVTKKTNTQNRIDKRDFVSLDPQQDRLKTELALESINYHYKRSDEAPLADDKNYYVEEVITSLACALPDVDLAVQAKREVGKLWEDISKKPYTDIMNSQVSALQVIRCVHMLRATTRVLKAKEANSTGRTRSQHIHSNRFVLHALFQKAGLKTIRDPSFDFAEFRRNRLDHEIEQLADMTKDIVDELYKTSLIHQVYRNFTKCREVKNKLNL